MGFKGETTNGALDSGEIQEMRRKRTVITRTRFFPISWKQRRHDTGQKKKKATTDAGRKKVIIGGSVRASKTCLKRESEPQTACVPEGWPEASGRL